MKMMNIKKLINKYWDIIPYAFFGVCTTAVNIVSYWVCAHLLKLGVQPSTIIAWVLSVLFAYLTNRKWVFNSQAHGAKEILKEITSFFGCRLATGVLDWACMLFFVDILKYNDVLIKILANVLVIVLNYVASKVVIFKKRGNSEEKQA